MLRRKQQNKCRSSNDFYSNKKKKNIEIISTEKDSVKKIDSGITKFAYRFDDDLVDVVDVDDDRRQ